MSESPGGPDLEKLHQLVCRLRGPDGCPWDRKQTLQDMRAYLLEEAHEAADAIVASPETASAELCAELGDLLFQVVFIAQLAAEQGSFSLTEVIDRIHAKMVERHPHVFGDARLEGAEAVVNAWEKRKLSQASPNRSLLAGLAMSLPALLRSYRMTQKAAAVGFDWPDATAVLDKVEEEIGELRQALRDQVHHTARPQQAAPSASVTEELGDLLFSVANLARHLQVDPEGALALTNRKFELRFAHLEREVAKRGRTLAEATSEEMEAWWREAKQAVKT
jgi:MazG family protein